MCFQEQNQSGLYSTAKTYNKNHQTPISAMNDGMNTTALTMENIIVRNDNSQLISIDEQYSIALIACSIDNYYVVTNIVVVVQMALIYNSRKHQGQLFTNITLGAIINNDLNSKSVFSSGFDETYAPALYILLSLCKQDYGNILMYILI